MALTTKQRPLTGRLIHGMAFVVFLYLEYKVICDILQVIVRVCRAFCVGGKDMNTRVYAAQRLANLVIYSLGGHTDLIVNAFFEKDSLDVFFFDVVDKVGVNVNDIDK